MKLAKRLLTEAANIPYFIAYGTEWVLGEEKFSAPDIANAQRVAALALKKLRFSSVNKAAIIGSIDKGTHVYSVIEVVGPSTTSYIIMVVTRDYEETKKYFPKLHSLQGELKAAKAPDKQKALMIKFMHGL